MKEELPVSITVKEDIIIPAGTVLKSAAVLSRRVSPHYSVYIGYGNDHCAEFVLPLDTIEKFPDKFEKSKNMYSTKEINPANKVDIR
jgi:hypothetical protein